MNIMKKNLLVFLCFAFFTCYLQVNGQKLAAEKIVDISGKANRGYIGNVVRNDQTREIVVTYVTKSTNSKVKLCC